MKIAYVSSSRIPSEFANSVQVMRMAEAFSQQGHEVVLFARRERGPGRDDHQHYGVTRSFRLVKCGWPKPDALGAVVYAALVATGIASRLHPDLVYARNLPVLVLLGRSSIPAVFEIHRPLTGARLALARWLFRQPTFRRLVVVSDALRDEYRRLCPELEPERITVARSGVTPDDPAAPPASLHGPRDPSRVQVGYIGSGYPGKGLEVILPLAAQSPEFDFHVIGGGPPAFAPLGQDVAAPPNLHFHGFVPPARVQAYGRAMDVLIAPYQARVLPADGRSDIGPWMSPLKLFEYMAASRPIVASNLPAIREVLHDGITALLVPPDDLAAWRAALERLKSAPLRRHLAANARRLVIDEYTWAARARKVLASIAPP